MLNELLLLCSLKATVILIAAAALCGILRRASASTRHLIWTMATAALLLLPLPVPSRVAPQVRQAIRLPAAQAFSVSLSSQPEQHDWIAIIWLAGAALVLARFAVGTTRVWVKTRRSQPMDIPGVPAGVSVLDAGRGAMPMAWRVFRPVILIPPEAVEGPPARLRVVLLNDLAHISRHDILTLAMAELSLAMYWFHPLAWWAASRMRN